uniref:phosphoserine phosphatase n=1 Tax=candidate division WOR-3 bacterium TaxID=2052148 RepID=A0A7V4E4D8_UNCW3
MFFIKFLVKRIEKKKIRKKLLFASDFDQTLSYDDTGILISLELGIPPEKFLNKVKEIRERNITQLGGELAYLLAYDPEYKNKVSKSLLLKIGEKVRLKANVDLLFKVLQEGINGCEFVCYVISACPDLVIKRSLSKILSEENIFGTEFKYDEEGKIVDILKTAAGHGKASIIDYLVEKEHIPRENVIYIGDGSSDIHVMLHVNIYGGFTIAVSPSPYLGHISKRTVLSENALAVLCPILEDLFNYTEEEIKDFYAQLGHPIYEWNRAKLEWLTIA